jgi:hypothetical protein
MHQPLGSQAFWEKDKKGKVLNQKVLFSGVFQETID